ncbi:MAG: DUF1697 domain-containing protein [Candidatus Levybacteria bacterium]|nr:DUF1697 domain-containing protein [Candidatus Levybacteria bacterium]
MRYVALLRGINVGGKSKVSMEDLKKIFLSLGFSEIKTLLNSGNVIFSSDKNEIESKDIIEKALSDHYLKVIPVLVRSIDAIHAFVKKDPFKGIEVTKDTRLYITFLSEPKKSSFSLPFISSDKAITILSVSDSEVCTLVTLLPQKSTTDLMVFLEKEFGKQITTRNWNTVVKIDKS